MKLLKAIFFLTLSLLFASCSETSEINENEQNKSTTLSINEQIADKVSQKDMLPPAIPNLDN